MTDPDELLTHRDLAQLLDVPEKSLHAYRIPHARIGKQELLDRYRHRLVAQDDGCWVWHGSSMNGYGRINYEGKIWLAHRLFYTLLVGSIPDGKVIDHLCRVRNCLNPEHMEVTTQQVNVKRGLMGVLRPRPTHCPSGHAYEDPNIYYAPKGYRVCRTCKRIKGRKEYRLARN